MKIVQTIIFLVLFFNPFLFANESEINFVSQFMEKTPQTEKGIKLFLDENNNDALNYFISLSDKGNSAGSTNAGIIYEYIEKNDEKAMHYYSLAAKRGSPLGQYNYGVLLYYVKENPIEAYKWILCSAEQNYSEAIIAKQNMKNDKIITDEQIKEAEALSINCKN